MFQGPNHEISESRSRQPRRWIVIATHEITSITIANDA